MARVVDILGVFMRLSNSNDGGLWAKNGRHEVFASKVANARDTESSISEVSGSQAVAIELCSDVLQAIVQFENAFVLHLLDDGNREPVLGIDCHRVVMIVLHDIALDVAFFIKVVVDVRVYNREFKHC